MIWIAAYPQSQKSRGRQGLVDACTGGVFANLATFRKLDDAYVDPVTDEGFYREMMEYLLERTSGGIARW